MANDLCRHFQAAARNNRWANHRLHRACGALSPGEFTAARTGFFPSIAATLNHIHAIDLYYLDALEEGGVGRAAWRELRRPRRRAANSPPHRPARTGG